MLESEFRSDSLFGLSDQTSTQTGTTGATSNIGTKFASNNQLFFINNSFTYANGMPRGLVAPSSQSSSNVVNQTSNMMLATTKQQQAANKVCKPNFAMTKQLLLSNAINNARQQQPNAMMFAADPNSTLRANNSEPMFQFDASTSSSSVTTLPPILAGKRINLPLGPHRYL